MDLPTGSLKRRFSKASRSPLALLVIGWLAGLGLPTFSASTQNERETFHFQEVFDLLKQNLAGTSDSELNRAAVRGLLEQLAGKVSVVGETATPSSPIPDSNAVSSTVFDGNFAYLRLTQLNSETERHFDSLLRQVRATNSLKGIVLDLRFASGQDYSVAVALADRFLASEQPMVDWGEGWKLSTAKTNAIQLPLAVLVNGRTTGAAEVLAGVLRHREIGLLIGSRTAGQASMSREFTLKTGQRLRVAIAPVKVAQGQELPLAGIKPDIEVETNPEDELAWYQDVFRSGAKPARSGLLSSTTNEPAGSLTNRTSRRRMNEAELVRMNREGQTPEREPTQPSSRPGEASPRPVNDPALARALDLLKGLAVVQQSRSL